jgi:hypothetical protein
MNMSLKMDANLDGLTGNIGNSFPILIRGGPVAQMPGTDCFERSERLTKELKDDVIVRTLPPCEVDFLY